MKQWALEVAAIGRHEAEEIAKCAAESPRVFRDRFRLAHLKAQLESIGRARQELRGAHSALWMLPHTYIVELHQSDLGLELGVITSQLASALALLEEV
jgi:hypothetical protein